MRMRDLTTPQKFVMSVVATFVAVIMTVATSYAIHTVATWEMYLAVPLTAWSIAIIVIAVCLYISVLHELWG